MRAVRYLLLAVFLVPALRAYEVDLDSGGYAKAWDSGPIPMRIMVPAPAASLIDGNTCAGSIQAAMQIWNAQLGVVQFSPQVLAPGTYASGNSINEIAMDSQYNSGATRKDFGTNTLAITVTFTQGKTRVESDLVFNTAFNWNSYRGNLRNGQQDIQRVALHELGHTLCLGHPDEAGQSVAAIMNSRVSNIDTLQADDIAGAQLFYGAPGFVPPNDDFANATPITLNSSSIQITGTNLEATRQSGEPSHVGANAPNGHSVWWRWTAPGSGSTTITTLGSNFDTVLAVYTGTSVSALTVFASNDDVEPLVPGVDNPNRIITSTVTFNAVGGTTYSIAVDGWGSAAQQDMNTNMGAITLNLSYAGPLGGNTAPSITTQPVSQTVTAGSAVTFTAAASGTPTPTYQWRKNGAAISGATGSSYTIATTNAASAGSYTVVATNSAGSVTSNIALLNVVIPPGGAIITITVE